MEGKFDVTYIKYLFTKHYEWYKEKQNKREAYKKGRSHFKRDCENSTGSSGSGKGIAIYSQIQSAL